MLDRFPELESYQQELTALGYSDAQSQEIVEALLTARQVIDAKHNAYTDLLNAERLGDMTPEAVASFVRALEGVLLTITPMEGAKVVALLFKQAQKDKDPSGLVFEKFEARRKLMRYEHRAFKQLRKKSQVIKIIKLSQRH